MKKNCLKRSKNPNINSSAGFTLIELLIVIAIIGILASILIPNLFASRRKAQDATVQSQMASLRAQAVLYSLSNSGTYGLGGATPAAACGTSTSVIFSNVTDSLYKLINAISAISGTANMYCNTNGDATNVATAWAVAARGSTTTEFFCADSTGVSRRYNATTSPAATGLTGVSGTGVLATASSVVCN